MVRPHEVLETLKLAIESSGELSTDVDYILHEADQENSDSDIELPAIQIQPITNVRVNPNNTDLVGYVTDSSGNRTGRLYHAEYELGVQIDVWVPEDRPRRKDASALARQIGNEVRDALYPYSSYGPEKQFTDDNGEPVDEIWRFVIDDGSPNDDIFQTPTVRRWEQDVEVWAYEVFNTSEDYITAVNHPAPGDFQDTDADGVIEATQ